MEWPPRYTSLHSLILELRFLLRNNLYYPAFVGARRCRESSADFGKMFLLPYRLTQQSPPFNIAWQYCRRSIFTLTSHNVCFASANRSKLFGIDLYRTKNCSERRWPFSVLVTLNKPCPHVCVPVTWRSNRPDISSKTADIKCGGLVDQPFTLLCKPLKLCRTFFQKCLGDR